MSFNRFDDEVPLPPEDPWGHPNARLDDTSQQLFRSEPMKYFQILVPREQARVFALEVGKRGFIQFVDFNANVSAFHREFVDKIKLCDDMLRSINRLSQMVENARLPIFALEQDSILDRVIPADLSFEELPEHLHRITLQSLEIEQNYEELAKQNREIIEYSTVVLVCTRFFKSSDVRNARQLDADAVELVSMSGETSPVSEIVSESSLQRNLSEPLLEEKIDQDVPAVVMLNRIIGTISSAKRIALERMLFRATRGNVVARFIDLESPLEDPLTRELQDKYVFILFFSGKTVENKIRKILSALYASVYTIPDTKSAQNQLFDDLEQQKEQQSVVLYRTKSMYDENLKQVAIDISYWKILIQREKDVYIELNKFNPGVSKANLVAEGWCPFHQFDELKAVLTDPSLFDLKSAPIMAIIDPPPDNAGLVPTYFRTNKFTSVFQGIVDSYGHADYREFNPGVFTIITFPFLFAVMFGDIGHGFLLALVAVVLIVNEKSMLRMKNMNEMIKIVFDGRYIILLMGIFSIYTGFIYNEAFSLPLPWWGGTKWTDVPKQGTIPNPAQMSDVYGFGVDPVWGDSATSLQFFNSLKMKMAIVFGVTQMVVGIILDLLNSIYFNRRIDIWFQFVPQLIFMLSIFGYLCLLILIKWSINWQLDRQSTDPPSLLQMLITMFMSGGNYDKNVQLYGAQGYVETVLFLTSIICVPWILISKPFILWKRHQKMDQFQRLSESRQLNLEADPLDDQEEFNFSEICTLQLIHTLEFVLGAISNTASYLRLWALSLAHAQLSKVFWDYFIDAVLLSNPIIMFGSFAVWLTVTVGVLMVMESLSSFLHALRLHWVEFQNKFYHGNGKSFLPFRLDE